MSLSNFTFVMIYIIHKILELLKNHLNAFECFLKSLIDFFFQKKKNFSITFNNGKFKS